MPRSMIRVLASPSSKRRTALREFEGNGPFATPSPLELYRDRARLEMFAAALDSGVGSRADWIGPATRFSSVQIGAAAALERSDWVVPALGEIAFALRAGLDAERFAARALDAPTADAKGGPFTLAAGVEEDGEAPRILAGSASLGGRLTQAAGVAMALRLRSEGSVCLVSFGTRTAARGDFHVALDLAARFSLPMVFLLRVATMSRANGAESELEHFATRCEAAKLTASLVDGEDPLAVRKAVGEALDSARGGTPVAVLAEVDGASDGDEARHRFDDYVTSRGDWDAAAFESWREGCAASLREAFEGSKAAGERPVRAMFDDVFAGMPGRLARQADEAGAFVERRRG